MKPMAAAAKTVAEMFRNPNTYSSKEFAAAAGTIAEKSGEVLARAFRGWHCGCEIGSEA